MSCESVNFTEVLRAPYFSPRILKYNLKKYNELKVQVQLEVLWIGPWLPEGDSQILRSHVFGPSGLKDYGSATLRCKIWSLPFLGLRPHALHPGAIQKFGHCISSDKLCHLAKWILSRETEGFLDRPPVLSSSSVSHGGGWPTSPRSQFRGKSDP